MKKIIETLGIGGSEVKDVFSLKPYGCRRRLWYEKTGATIDYPRLFNEHMQRGTVLEPFVASLYQKRTGNALVRIPKKALPLRKPLHPFISGHPDRIHKKDGSPVEIKCPGRRVFMKIKAEGLQEDYILQLQQYIYLCNSGQGHYAIFCAETGDFLSFQQARQEGLIQEMIRAEVSFWTEVQDNTPPPKLEIADARCGRCIYRITCQGQEIEEVSECSGELEIDLAPMPILQEYIQARIIYDEAEDYLGEVKGQIKEAMGDRRAVEVPRVDRIYYSPLESKRWDTKALEAKHPELMDKFKRVNISRALRIYCF